MENENQFDNFDLKNIVKKEYVENDQTLCFDTIPIYKIIILTVVTAGAYEIILFYSWWKKLKIDFGYKVSPFWRAIFSGFSVFWLFPIFEKYFKCFNIKDFKAGVLAILFFSICFISNRMAFSKYSDTITYQIIDFGLTIVITAICCFVQNRINKINENSYPQAKVNNWKISNTIWTIICSILIILSIIPQK